MARVLKGSQFYLHTHTAQVTSYDTFPRHPVVYGVVHHGIHSCPVGEESEVI